MSIPRGCDFPLLTGFLGKLLFLRRTQALIEAHHLPGYASWSASVSHRRLPLSTTVLNGNIRGLPVAIDRAVMLPSEFKKQDQVVDETHSTYSNFPRTRTRASSAYPGSAYAPGSQNELPLGEKSFPLGHTSTVQPSMMPEKPLPHTSTIPAGIPVDKTLVDDDFRTTH